MPQTLPYPLPYFYNLPLKLRRNVALDRSLKKKFKMPKPSQNVSVSHKWTIAVVAMSFALSVVFSAVTSVLMESMSILWAFVILFAIIGINILFDIIGTAVMSAEEYPFHSLASRRVRGAAEAIKIIRHAPQVSNLCCDVIGDIAGIISGATTALIVAELVAAFSLSGMLPSLLLTGLVSSMTIGGKAVCKGIAMQNGNSIVYFIGKISGVIRRR